MVPEGWFLTPIGKHIDLLSGFPFKSSGYIDEGGVRLLRGDNIEPGNLRWKNAKHWREGDYDELEKYQLKEGDFVIAMDRTWISSGLKVAQVTQGDVPSLLVQRVSRIRALFSIEQSLLRQYFSGYRFEQYVKAVQKETAVPHISAAQIKDFPVLLPPKKEQQKIAEILSTWDEAIATTEQFLASSEQQKKALMQQLLTGKKRLPGFEEEWRTVKLGEICSLGTGQGAPQGDKYFEGGRHEFVRVSDIGSSESRYAPEARDKVNDLAVKENRLKKVGAGATLFTKSGASLLLNQRAQLNRDVYIVSHLGFAEATKCSSSDFIYYLFKMIDFTKIAAGTSLPALQISALRKVKITVPDKKEQRAIAQVLSCSDQETEELRGQVGFLREEKKALMQQLLTGKRRVRIDEAQRATA